VTATIEFPDLYKVMLSINLLQEHGGPDGHDGNEILIWDDLQPDMQRNPYCAAGDCYLWKHAGRPYDPIDHKWGFSYCPDAVSYFQRKGGGWWDTSGHYAPGDTIFYVENGIAGHTGTLVWDNGKTMLVFECNTSPDGGFGSQNDGGGCYFRHRPHSSFVMGAAKTSRWLGQPKPAAVRPGIPAVSKKVPPKGVAAPTTPKALEADMQILIKQHTDPAVFITDGVTKRHIRSQAELAVLVNTGLVVHKVSEVDPAVLAAIPTVGAPA
jgi:hypothetical protein